MVVVVAVRVRVWRYVAMCLYLHDISRHVYPSAYGKFFLQWYSGELIAHAERVLPLAQAVFEPLGVPIAGKVSGVHWWYLSPQHAAECTAGYYNTNNNNAYLEIAKAFAKYNADFDFTCMEMTDNESGFAACDSGPVQLVQQAKGAAHEAGIGTSEWEWSSRACARCGRGCNSLMAVWRAPDFSGENALNVYSTSSCTLCGGGGGMQAYMHVCVCVCVCVCGCVCGCVAVWLCGCVAVWANGSHVCTCCGFTACTRTPWTN